MTAILSIDVGTTSVRAAVVDGDLAIRSMARRPFAPSTPFPGLVEFDAAALVQVVLDAVGEATASSDPVTAVGITNQRASTILWDRATGEPVAPALGWQDLRTVGECLAARAEHDLALAPNQSATKLAWLLANTPGVAGRDLCFGTVDTWLAWSLSGGAIHVTDPSNAGVTGLMALDGAHVERRACSRSSASTRRCSRASSTPRGVVGEASAIPGGAPIAALVGDQQASLVGQGCVVPGRAKITFGTGGMLDVCHGPDGPSSARRGEHGTYPIVAWSRDGEVTWGAEAIMLAAGMNVDWLREDLGLIATSEESHDVAASVDTADGVVFVPALLGLGTPQWDYGARGTLLGVTRGTTRAHVVRAVLEGVAHRGADLVAAAEADTGLTIERLRVDGGMSTNPTFTSALATATGRPVEVSPVVEATTRRRGVPRRPRHRRLGRHHRRRPGLDARSGSTSPTARSTARRGRAPSNGPPAGSRSCPRWTSDHLLELPGVACGGDAVGTEPAKGHHRVHCEPSESSTEWTTRSSRRRLLAAGVSGTALGLLGSRVVSASTDTTTPTSEEGTTPAPATTTTLPPRRPTEADIALLQFAETFELAARDLYRAAVDAGVEGDAFATMAANHQAYASVLRGILGVRGALGRADDVFDTYEADFASSDTAAVAEAAYGLESVAVATHTEIVGRLEGTDAARVLGSILVVEARQAAVLADVRGLGDDFDAMFENDAEPVALTTASGG